MEKVWIIYTEQKGILGVIPKNQAKTQLEAISIWGKEYIQAKLVNKDEVKK